MTTTRLTPKPQSASVIDDVLDKAFLYDYRIHGPLGVGETLILYRDGTFEKVKHGR